MKGIEQRRAEGKAQAKADKQRRKKAKAPIILPVMIGSISVLTPLMAVYSPIYEKALPAAQADLQKVFVLQDTKLQDIATEYNIPLTQEQAFLVQEGDTFLPQFEKIQLDDEQEIALIEMGYNPLSSSNIAGVRIDGADLLIRFHSGDIYRYPNKAEMFYPFNEALSPGRLLHRTIRFAKGYSQE